MLAVTAAEVAVDQDFWSRTAYGVTAIDRARAAIDGASSPALAFDLLYLALRHDYDEQLFGPGPGYGDMAAAPWRSPAAAEALAERASALRERAPDPARRARAAFYVGVIDELLRGDPAAARLAYEEALRLGEQAGDELIVSYACRHLGFHVVGDGDQDRGRELLRRSMELRQRLGCVPLALAQQLALAEVDGTAAVAGTVRDWATAAFPTSWLVRAAAPAAD